MIRAPNKAKRSGQSSGPIGPQLASALHAFFYDTNTHTGVSSSCMWSDIYEVVAIENPSNKPPPRVVCDDEEEYNEP